MIPPHETKSLPISLTVHKLGDLRVTSLEYSLHHVDRLQQVSQSLYVTGRLNLRPCGKRRGPVSCSASAAPLDRASDSLELDDLLEGRNSDPFTAPRETDYRLSLSTCPAFPLLKTRFLGVPFRMLQGQVQPIEVQFCNESTSCSLKLLRMLCNWPGFFSLAASSGRPFDLMQTMPETEMKPTETRNLKAWVRAPHFSSNANRT
ncbi:hypothetical protein Ciccas_002115 [Cichlidogyrus casuarinus]|uniref:Uncharacterized protein n=1 Tax=Cichlidogyrus casuarinus TaxID=1844966 RepID=A0ABD2QLC1_9PLAT